MSLRDLPATVVDLLGLASGSPFAGESLAAGWASPSMETAVEPTGPFSALSEVVPIDPVEPESAELLSRRRAWASLAEGDWIYIRREGGDPEELFDLHTDGRERHNRAGDPTLESVIGRLRRKLDKMTAGPLTHERFNP